MNSAMMKRDVEVYCWKEYSSVANQSVNASLNENTHRGVGAIPKHWTVAVVPIASSMPVTMLKQRWDWHPYIKSLYIGAYIGPCM